MSFPEINNPKTHKIILIGLIMAMVFGLNLFLLNKVISGHETERSLEKAIKIKY